MPSLHPKLKHHVKYHSRFIPHYLLVAFLTFIATFGIYSLFPPNVRAINQDFSKLDQKIQIVIWGWINKETLEVRSNLDTPLSAVVESDHLNLKHTLTITPDDLLYPETEYQFDVIVKNWLGLESIKSITVSTSSIPTVTIATPLSAETKMPANTVLVFNVDNSFNPDFYNFTSTPTYPYTKEIKNNQLLINPLTKLTQGEDYFFSLRLNSSTLGKTVLLASQFTVIDPLQVVSSIPKDNESVVSKNTIPIITFSKEVAAETLVGALNFNPKIEFETSWSDRKTLQLKPKKPFLTGTKYTLSISDKLTAVDGSVLLQNQTINFQTAGKVKVTNFTPSGGNTSLTSTIKVDFDQSVDHESAERSFSLTPTTQGTFSWSGNSLIFKPTSLELLTTYKITITSGVQSVGGENSTETFSHSFSTTSERSRTIGYSVNGRPITATYFGVGPKKIMLIGTLHGSESNTGNMLSQWISYLRANQQSIAKDRTFVIVPYSNPDGRALNRRFNANNVDLNRNWGTPDWQALTYWQSRSYPKGGGSAPFSEPETKALRNLINLENPSHLITYHSAANMVIGDGIANSFGNWYAKKTGYTRVYGDDEDESSMSALGYVITGTLEEWTTIKGVVTLVVELISASSSEYNRNFPALKGLLTYPI